MSENMITVFTENLIAQRKRIGLSQKELAAKLGITHDAMSRMERGKMLPKMGRLEDIANALQCSISSLFEMREESAEQRAKIIAELIESLSENQQEAVMNVVYATVTAIKTKT